LDAETLSRNLVEIARDFAGDRSARQLRTALDRADFDRLAQAGLLGVGLPTERGGLWCGLPESARTVCEAYRVLAHGDSSVALSASMHPAVLAFWLATPDVPAPDTAAWQRQRETIFETVEAGAWWGTITSEPGSGGDVTRTTTSATRDGDRWRLTGRKHFGSGTGITSYMLTTARAEGDDEPDWFYVPVAGSTLDGSDGITLAAPWDGHGMRATQSHALTFDGCVAVRSAWPGHLTDLVAAASPFFGTLFTAVVLGIVETAVDAARERLRPRLAALRPFEQVEWAQAELDAWTVEQVYEGALRAIERGEGLGAALRAKTAASQLAESCLLRVCRVLGGGTFSQSSPFGHWFEDVRALGFLRPPWGLAFDALVANALAPPE
jgi:alkylation response protein AidB-like acyl-CoA dehydrogenase